MPINYNILQPQPGWQVYGQIAPQPQDDIMSGIAGLLSGLSGLAGAVGGAMGGATSAASGASNLVQPGTAMGNAVSRSFGQQTPSLGSHLAMPQINSVQSHISNQMPKLDYQLSSGFSNRAPNEQITGIIAHDTGGGTLKSSIQTLQERKLGYHYLIDRDGTPYNLIPPDKKAFHAKGFNDGTIGVSMVGSEKNPVTPQQQNSLIQLSNQLKQQYPSLRGISGHKDNSHAGKTDPHGLDFNMVASNTGLQYTNMDNLRKIQSGPTKTFSGSPPNPYNAKPSPLTPMSTPPNSRGIKPAPFPPTNSNVTLKSLSGATPTSSIQEAIAAARRVYPDNPTMAKVAATQAIHESGLAGGRGSGLARNYNNLFGIKGQGTAGSVTMPTKEFVGGRMQRINAGFARNKTYDDSFVQHGNLMNKPRYQSVREAQTPQDAFNALQKSGYATDPNYAKYLNNVYKKYVEPAFEQTVTQALGQKLSLNDSPNNILPSQPPAGVRPTPAPTYKTPPKYIPTGIVNPQAMNQQQIDPLQEYFQQQLAQGNTGINWGLLQALNQQQFNNQSGGQG